MRGGVFFQLLSFVFILLNGVKESHNFHFESYQLKMRLPIIHIHVYICKRGGDVNGTRFSLYAWCVWMCLNTFTQYLLIFRTWFFSCAMVLYWWLNSIQHNSFQFSSVQWNAIFAWLSAWKWGRKNAETLAANWLISCDFLTISVHSFHSTLDYVPVPLTSRQRPLNIWMGQFDYIQFISFAFSAHFPNTHQTNAAYFFPLFLSQHRDLFFSSSIFKWFEIEKYNFKLIDLFSAKRKSNRLPWKTRFGKRKHPSLDWLTGWRNFVLFGPGIDLRKNPSLIQNRKSVAPFDTIPIYNLSNTWHSNRACIVVMIVQNSLCPMFLASANKCNTCPHRYFLCFGTINLEFSVANVTIIHFHPDVNSCMALGHLWNYD